MQPPTIDASLRGYGKVRDTAPCSIDLPRGARTERQHDMALTDWLKQLPEQELYPIIEELLRAMGYLRIECVHGPTEVGKDIVFMQEDPLHRQVWRAVQVKTRLSGKAGTSNHSLTAVRQCEASLRNLHLTSAGPVSIQEVWLITSHALHDMAKRYIQDTLDDRSSRVLVIDGPHLADLITEYIPHLVHADQNVPEQYLANLATFADTPDDYLSTAFKVKFNTGTFFVWPDAGIELLDPPAMQTIPSLIDTIPWETLNHIDLKLRLAANALLPLCEISELRLILRRLQTCAETMQRSGWEPLQASRFAGVVEDLATTFTAKARDPHVRNADIDEIDDLLRALPDTKLDPLRTFYRIHEGERLDSKAYFTKRRFEIKQPQLLQETLLKVHQARATLIQDLVHAYTKLSSRTSLTDLVIQISRILHDRRLPQEHTIEHGDWQTRVDVMKLQLHSFGDHVNRLKDLYLSSYDQVKNRLKSKLTLDEFGPEELGHLSTCNQLTFLFVHIHGDQEGLKFFNVDLASTAAAQNIILYGGLGMGKTTVAKRLCWQQATKYHRGPGTSFPVYITLAALRFVKSTGGNSELTEATLLECAAKSFPGMADIFIHGSCWYLDGLDEMGTAEDQKRIIEWAIAPTSAARRLVLTSRPYALPPYVPNMLRVEVLPFTAAKRDEFIRRLPWTTKGEAELLAQTVNTEPDLSALAQIPLLLTLLVILAKHDGAKNVPSRREKVYKRIVSLMLYEWDRQKGVQRQYAIADEDLRLTVAWRIAYHLHQRRDRSFHRRTIVDVVMQTVPTITSEAAESYFDDLLRDCVVISVGSDNFAFFHLSMQEYLAALALNEDLTLHRVNLALEDYFRADGWWEEPLVFLAAMRRDASSLINELHRHVVQGNRERAHARLRHLIERWLQVADMTNIEDLKPSGSVAEVLGVLDLGGKRDRWMKIAQIQRASDI
jgi:hypothetical protein